LDGSVLVSALREAGSTTVAGPMPGIVDLLVGAGLVKSKSDGRRTIDEGGVYLNNVRVDDPQLVPGGTDLLAGSWLVLRRGKKHFAGVEVLAR
jgi:tyrosyl-tRNA synthetase